MADYRAFPPQDIAPRLSHSDPNQGNNILDSVDSESDDRRRLDKPPSSNTIWLPQGFEFLAELPTAKRKSRILMPMQAYVDESGGRGQSPWVVLAGLIGEAQEWAEFSDLWRFDLAKPPAIRALHMRDAFNLQGEFRGWSEEGRDSRIRRLASLVNGFNFIGTGAFVDADAYEELVARDRSQKRGRNQGEAVGKIIDDPYFLAFNGIIMATCYEVLDQGKTDQRFEMIFDDSRILGQRAKRWYPVVRDGMEPHEEAIMPIEPLFRDDEEFVPLQVADMIAWLLRRELDGKSHTFGWIPETMHGLSHSSHLQIFDRPRLRLIKQLSQQLTMPISEYQRMNRLLGLDEETAE